MTALVFTSAPAARLMRFRSRSSATRSLRGIRTPTVTSFCCIDTATISAMFNKSNGKP